MNPVLYGCWPLLLLTLVACSETRRPVPPPPPQVAPSSPPAKGVRCGTATCAVPGEKCCPGQVSTCVARSSGPAEPYCENATGVRGALYCDDSRDCAPPERCCWNAADSENRFTTCSASGCDLSVACLADADCAAGFRCTGVTPTEPGECVLAAPRTTCGNALCSGATPVCCYDESNGATRCAPDGERPCSQGDALGFAVRCQSPEECGGERCCGFYHTYCAASCINAGIVCQKDLDCPQTLLGIRLVGCRPTTDPQQPPWLRLCTYEQPT